MWALWAILVPLLSFGLLFLLGWLYYHFDDDPDLGHPRGSGVRRRGGVALR